MEGPAPSNVSLAQIFMYILDLVYKLSIVNLSTIDHRAS